MVSSPVCSPLSAVAIPSAVLNVPVSNNPSDGIATADNGAQTGELAMNLADGNLTSSIILFPQTVASVSYTHLLGGTLVETPEGMEVDGAEINGWGEVKGDDVNADL